MFTDSLFGTLMESGPTTIRVENLPFVEARGQRPNFRSLNLVKGGGGAAYQYQVHLASSDAALEWVTDNIADKHWASRVRSSNPAKNKPLGDVLWTSTWRGGDILDTEWGEWTKDEMPDKITPHRDIFKVSKRARVLRIDSQAHYDALVALFPGGEESFIAGDTNEFKMEGYAIDWLKLVASKKIDAIHVPRPRRIPELDFWQVDSTVWFNWGALLFPSIAMMRKVEPERYPRG